MDEQFIIKFDPNTGERLETYPLDSTITEERKAEMIEEGFEVVSREAWELLIGNVDGKEYVKDVATGSGYIEKPPYVTTLEEAQESKIAELKKARDTKEIEPVRYIDHYYDFDTKSFDRINAAIIALDQTHGVIGWTTADNTVVEVNADTLRGVIAAAAVRSNTLHVTYRNLKAEVMAATTNAEVEAISWPEE